MDIQNPAVPAAESKRKKVNGGKKNGNAVALDKKNRKRRRRGKGIFIMLGFLVLALLSAGVYMVIHFNIDGWRDRIIETINSLDPVYVENEIKINNIVERSMELSSRERALQDAESELNTRIANVELREAEVAAGSVSGVPIYKPPISGEFLVDLQNLAKTYAAMEPADAALILATLYTIEDMAAIIYYMKPAAAADVLTEMDVRLAAEITQELLRQ